MNAAKIKSSFTRIVTSKRVTSGEAHLWDFAVSQHNSKNISQLWQTVENTVSDLTGTEIKALTSPKLTALHHKLDLTETNVKVNTRII